MMCELATYCCIETNYSKIRGLKEETFISVGQQLGVA